MAYRAGDADRLLLVLDNDPAGGGLPRGKPEEDFHRERVRRSRGALADLGYRARRLHGGLLLINFHGWDFILKFWQSTLPVRALAG